MFYTRLISKNKEHQKPEKVILKRPLEDKLPFLCSFYFSVFINKVLSNDNREFLCNSVTE